MLLLLFIGLRLVNLWRRQYVERGREKFDLLWYWILGDEKTGCSYFRLGQLRLGGEGNL